MYRTTFLTTLILSINILFAQDDVKYIKLFKEKSPLQFVSFHISAIKDDRPDTSKIGILHTGLTGKKNTTLKLYPGAQKAVTDFIKANYKQDTATTAIELHIININVAHSRNGLKNHLDVSFGIAYYIAGEKITDYNGEGSSDGAGDPAKPIEELLRKTLQNGLQGFDAWWQKNKQSYLATKGAPTTIIVEPVLPKSIPDTDIILYNPGQPLKHDDFTGEPDDLSGASAVTHSGIQIRLSSLTKDGTAKVQVQILPYFDKNNSWFRKSSRNAKTLLHEQKHFDITALKACELMQTIKKFTFTADYARELETLHKQNEKDWDLLQRTYDTETNHGQTNSAQQKWNQKLQEQLAKCACYGARE